MRKLNLVGNRYGKLLVLEYAGSNGKRSLWRCVCDCGNECVKNGTDLQSGGTKSCGCYRAEACRKNFKRHGDSKTVLFRKWQHMIYRCYYNNNHSKWYKDKGITVCQEWLNSFEEFRDWALSNGYEEGLTIDRIDNSLGYCPENCRFVTNLVQENNRTNNIRVEYNGNVYTVAELSRLSGIKYSTLRARISRGWSIEDAVSVPIGGNRNE